MVLHRLARLEATSLPKLHIHRLHTLLLHIHRLNTLLLHTSRLNTLVLHTSRLRTLLRPMWRPWGIALKEGRPFLVAST